MPQWSSKQDANLELIQLGRRHYTVVALVKPPADHDAVLRDLRLEES